MKTLFLNRVRLRTRITIGLLSIGGIFLIVALMIGQVLSETTRGFEAFSELNAEALDEVRTARAMDVIQRKVLRYISMGDDYSKSEVERLYIYLKEAFNKEAGDPRVRVISHHLENYYRYFLEVAQQREKSETILEKKYHATFTRLEDQMQREMAAGTYDNLPLFAKALLSEKHLSHYFSTLDGTALIKANRYAKEAQQALSTALKSQKNRQKKARLEELQRSLEAFKHTYTAAVESTKSYLFLVNVVMAAEAYEVLYLMNERSHEKLQTLKAQESGIVEATTSLYNNLFYIATGLIALAVLVNFFVTRSITGPIQRLAELFNRLSQGDLSAEVPTYRLKDEIGALTKAAGVFRQKSVELEEKAQALELSNRYKSEFLANMSHELRTPLNSITVLSRLFSKNSKGNLSEQQVHQAEVIFSAGQDLLQLINDILDLSKIEAKMMTLHLSENPVGELSRQLSELFEAVVEEKRQHFSVIIDPNAPKRLFTDWLKVQQIVRNFLSNAVKFTPEEGTIKLHISVSPFKEYAIAIAVHDSGIGISKENQERIFNSFEQLDGGVTRQYGGTGLGLAISRELAQLLQGEIKVSSRPGKGSIFTLLLPERIDTHGIDPARLEFESVSQEGGQKAVEAAVDRGQVREAEREGLRVLIADDDERNRIALIALLQELGIHRIETAENGQEALQRLDETRFDLVLMDIMMPVMDGYEAIARIRRHPKVSGVKIAALTAKALKEDENRCLEAGADYYLSKPVDFAKLDAVLKAGA